MSDLNAITVFLAVADLRSFRGAAERLGVTRSAVSQAIRRLESDLGLALLQRTTRSVNLTEAGQAFHARVAPAMTEIDVALAHARDREQTPRGLLRLAVSTIAESFLSGPLLAGFAERYPDVALEVTVTDQEFDITAQGYDAGVRLGEVIEKDMIAIPASPDQRQVAVAAPSYLAAHGAPEHPRDLAAHRCIGWRPVPGGAPYRWEFAEDGRAFDVEVEPEVTTNDIWLMVRLARAGAGITFGMEETFAPYIGRGELATVLERYCPAFPGFFLYYPNRRHLAPKLRALVDDVRRWQKTATG
ncbi:LysR family transcriptional regulator [Pelagibacterium sp. 26DY04]|uniref:LysR family transcriptional regulator n=1 Tax=Pelagibacterium sp. 26DY04 TaxID=2967130 RepID=UPI002815CC0F|nr:LysR family transcriptional regulator [Pelagibacterium sp. 26DY04]WMT88730.1 LysR family transcriptional regulator [Pelagibacterium sp. 26DY04]